MVSTAIAPRTNGGVPDIQRGLGLEGMEGLDQSDLILPRKTIVQPTSKKEGADEHLGHFHDNLTNEMVPNIEAVILQISKARTLWSGDLNETKPECASYDGTAGRTYGTCAECQFNTDVNPGLWESNDMKRCNRGYLLLCVDRKDGTMFLLGAMGTSVKPAKILISQFVQKKRSPFSALVRFETVKIVDDKGKYFVLKPFIVKQLTAEETAEYREMHLALKGVQIADIDPDEAPQAAVAPSDDWDDTPEPPEAANKQKAFSAF